MLTDVKSVLIWLTGSIVGYFLARIVWKKVVSPEIDHFENVLISIMALLISWLLAISSVLALLVNLYATYIDDTTVYWCGKAGDDSEETEPTAKKDKIKAIRGKEVKQDLSDK